MRVAIVHDRFTILGGAERVVEQLHALCPTATIHTAVLDPSSLPEGLVDADIRPTGLQRIYRGGDRYAYLLPLIPFAIARIDVGDVDLVITSHHAFANRVRVPADIPVISYVNNPSNWIWDRRARAIEVGGLVGRLGLAAFARSQQRPDRNAAQRPRAIVANSQYVAERVHQYWHRHSQIVHPPIDVDWFTPDPSLEREDFFLFVGRLVPYKQPDVAVAAARHAGVRLVVVGDGRLRPRLEQLAGPGIELVGPGNRTLLRDLYRRCRALVFPNEEFFGIVALEAQACGAPVVARAVGGALETVVDGRTGVLYRADDEDDEMEALADALSRFDAGQFDPGAIRRQAERFSAERFRERFAGVVEAAVGSPLDG